YEHEGKFSWRELAARARQAGILVSKSTLFRRFRHEKEDQQRRMMESMEKMEESDERYGSLIVRRVSLSRHLKATMLNVYECGVLRQYSLIRGDKETGGQYYRRAKCVGWKRKQQDGRIAYLSVLNGKIVGRSGGHHPCCEPLDENKVFAKAVDRQCRLDVRRGQTNPRLAHIKGMERMMGASLNACSYFPRWSSVRRAYYRHRRKPKVYTASLSPSLSPSQEMMKNGGANMEDREIDASHCSPYGSPRLQILLTGSDSDTMTHFTVSQRSLDDGIFTGVRKGYEDSVDDGVVLSGTTPERPSDPVIYRQPSSVTQELIAELRTMKAKLEQHEERIRLLEEQLADRVIVETGENIVYR
uniref:FLYWCH-type domain-containing protein n=2 Tax=Parascaris univalens TaxID=6257 RepID=A0A915BCI8_PARUN